MTYSYLASALSNQAAAQARARELWRAPIAAARAIAFDPAQAQRWVRLAETLIELSSQAAAVLSSHATKLAPDDPVVRRNRIATLTNLGEAARASRCSTRCHRQQRRLVQRGPGGRAQGIRPRAVRGGRGRAPGPGPHRRQPAVRIEPQNLWYHLVRADVLLRAGKDDLASEDFEYLCGNPGLTRWTA